MSFTAWSSECSPLLRMISIFLVPLLFSMSKMQAVEANDELSYSFQMNGEDYVCQKNMICLGAAHTYKGAKNIGFSGVLSLAHDDRLESDIDSGGIAYYPKPIRLLDPATRRAASINTTFEFFEYSEGDDAGDGMTFVISADNNTVGKGGANFGIFDPNGYTEFKSVVIEFDSFLNNWNIIKDINNNHISIDFHNISAVVAGNVSELNITMSKLDPLFVWIEYFAQTQDLEVRISEGQNRPVKPFISHNVDLFDVVDEHMWVGFTGGNGANFSAYYVGNWSFEAYGIPPDPVYRARRRTEWRTSKGVFAAIVGVSAVVLALMASLVWVTWYWRRKPPKSGGYFKVPPIEDDRELGEPHRFSLEEIREATNGFADETKLGEGGFGCVYGGELPTSKALVAVKRISSESQQGERDFKAEVSVISQLRHRNLIRLLGCCIGDGKYYIVYDLMSNGSLDKVLTPSGNGEGTTPLFWGQRIKILQGVAAAVEYLHNGWNQRVIHRDIKASNIMLDDDWNAKLGDFGLARLADHHKTPHTMTVAGTPGYMAPEIVATRMYTEKTDVFAFGTLALEMACGRKSLVLHGRPQEIILVDWVWHRLSQGNLLSVVDRRLDQYDVQQVEAVLLLGLICTHPDPAARPCMRNVVQVLNGDAPVPAVPVQKPSSGYGISIDDWSSTQSEA